jgi:hypothetical protein
MAAKASFLSYVKSAFLWHWNLLAVGAGVFFSFLSRRPDMFLPLVSAIELLYLGMLSSNPRFRKAVDARRAAVPLAPDQSQLLSKIRNSINPNAWGRFVALQNRCRTLQNLSQQIQGPDVQDKPLQEIHTESLDRLLWMFLQLLYSLDALDRYLAATNRNDLELSIIESEKQIEKAKAEKRDEKLIRALEDKHETQHQRLQNYERTRDNRDLIGVEIDRIEQKVSAISEMAISSRDSSEIGAQVDGIAAGISATEDALRGLDVPPVFKQETAPRFLSQEF